LRAAGWTVIRFWEHEIEDNAEACARRVAAILAGGQDVCIKGGRTAARPRQRRMKG
jgi:very-short-patch-repair endonuclease